MSLLIKVNAQVQHGIYINLRIASSSTKAKHLRTTKIDSPHTHTHTAQTYLTKSWIGRTDSGRQTIFNMENSEAHAQKNRNFLWLWREDENLQMQVFNFFVPGVFFSEIVNNYQVVRCQITYVLSSDGCENGQGNDQDGGNTRMLPTILTSGLRCGIYLLSPSYSLPKQALKQCCIVY